MDLERRTQKSEADYRSSLLRVREKAKEIASYDGEIMENKNIQSQFTAVFSVWLKTLLKRRQLNYFHFGYSQISSVVPYLIGGLHKFSHRSEEHTSREISVNLPQYVGPDCRCV